MDQHTMFSWMLEEWEKSLKCGDSLRAEVGQSLAEGITEKPFCTSTGPKTDNSVSLFRFGTDERAAYSAHIESCMPSFAIPFLLNLRMVTFLLHLRFPKYPQLFSLFSIQGEFPVLVSWTLNFSKWINLNNISLHEWVTWSHTCLARPSWSFPLSFLWLTRYSNLNAIRPGDRYSSSMDLELWFI